MLGAMRIMSSVHEKEVMDFAVWSSCCRLYGNGSALAAVLARAVAAALAGGEKRLARTTPSDGGPSTKRRCVSANPSSRSDALCGRLLLRRGLHQRESTVVEQFERPVVLSLFDGDKAQLHEALRHVDLA